MTNEPSNESKSLQDQYLSMKRSSFFKFTNTLSSFVAIAIFFQLCYALWEGSSFRLLRAAIALLFALAASKFFSKPRKHQDVINVIFLIIWALFEDLLKKWNGFMDTATSNDVYYTAYTYSFMERIVAQKIPDIKHKRVYTLSVLLIHLFINTPGTSSVWLRQICIVAFVIYFDMNHDKNEKALFYSYSSSKDQLTQFKDLVVQDIPESIAIVSSDLSKTLFMNNPFKTLVGGEFDGPIKYYFHNFYIQDTSETIKQFGGSKRGQTTPKKRLLDYLVNVNKENSISSKQTFNLVYEPSRSFLSPGDPSNVDQQQQNNTERIFEAKAFPIQWDGEPSIALILHDITQQHTILSLKIADANKDLVLATVSHELRTPLNGMLGMIQIMQKRINDKEMSHYLSICKNSGSLLLGLVNSILDLNQIRLNKLKLNPEKINLFDLLNDIYGMFEFQCQQKNLIFKLDIGPSTPKYILSDKNRLSQIFINLLGNALKFTSEGGITISCQKSEIQGLVNFSIQDTGIGIRDENKEKLFTMFGRIESSDPLNKRLNSNGVGLGLTISNNLAKLLSGDYAETGNIKVKSTFGKGSTFSFAVCEALSDEVFDVSSVLDDSPKSPDWIGNELLRKMGKLPSIVTKSSMKYNFNGGSGEQDDITLTLIKSPSKHPKVKKNSSTFGFKSNLMSSMATSLVGGHLDRYSKKNTENPTRILIVDDNPFNIVVAEQLIASHGFKVETASSASAAIKIITENSYSSDAIQMVFMDCQMPEMDGYDATRVLKKLMKEKKIPEVPIVALTANNSLADREKCFDVGMCELLTKPLTDMDLRRVLRKYVTQEC